MAEDVLLDPARRPAAHLRIGEVAERTGLSVYTVPFYERTGLLAHPVDRVHGRRVFTEDHNQWLGLCAIMRASGMPLSALRAYTELVRHGDGNEDQRLALLREHHDRVKDQIRELSRCLNIIARKVSVTRISQPTASRTERASRPIRAGCSFSCGVTFQRQAPRRPQADPLAAMRQLIAEG